MTMSAARTLRALIDAGADDAPALNAPGSRELTYRALREQVDATVAALNAMGIGRGDKVAIVLPNGPCMASAFLAVAAGAASAPLNPAYRADEFEFYLNDLQARGLIVEAGSDSPAVAVARKLGVPVIELHAEPERGAGAFRLVAASATGAQAAAGGLAGPDDIALVLHTSGTT